MHTQSTEICLVPVPVRYLSIVYRALADELSVGVQARPEPIKAQPGADDPPFLDEATHRYRSFSKSELVQLKRELHPGSAVLVMLNDCAAQPGKPLGLDEIARRAGVSIQKARGQVSALTKHCNRLFQNRLWPVQGHWGLGGIKQMSYEMPQGTAELWSSIE